MSREIKFRAWDSVTKEMHKGSKKPYMYLTRSERKIGIGCNLHPSLYHDTSRSFEKEIILMQYTGLKDKNGVEIFEGDIVKWTHLKHWWTAVIEPIEMCPNGPLYAVERTNNMSVNDDEQYTYELTHSRMGARNELPFLSKSTEVIGNIYETPELLENK